MSDAFNDQKDRGSMEWRRQQHPTHFPTPDVGAKEDFKFKAPEARLDYRGTVMTDLVRYDEGKGSYYRDGKFMYISHEDIVTRDNLPNGFTYVIETLQYLTHDKTDARIQVLGWLDSVTQSVTTAIKHDSGKTEYHHMPPDAFEEVNKVLTFGAKKYAAYNYRAGFSYSRPFNAAMRHMWAYWRGEDKDPETGLNHLAHAVCCLLFILQHIADGKGVDDRYKEVQK